MKSVINIDTGIPAYKYHRCPVKTPRLPMNTRDIFIRGILEEQDQGSTMKMIKSIRLKSIQLLL